MIAANLAPGLLREGFGFEKWGNFQQSAWKQLVREARQAGSDSVSCPIIGMDKDRSAIQSARHNAKRAGVQDYVRFVCQDVLDLEPEADQGLILTNPPYGHRLDLPEDTQPFYKGLGDVLKHKCKGWTAEIFTGDSNPGQADRASHLPKGHIAQRPPGVSPVAVTSCIEMADPRGEHGGS